MTTTSISHNQFLNSSTAVGVYSITMKYTFFHFSNLSFDKVAFVKAHFPLSLTVFSGGLDYPSNTSTPPSTSLFFSLDPRLIFFSPSVSPHFSLSIVFFFLCLLFGFSVSLFATPNSLLIKKERRKKRNVRRKKTVGRSVGKFNYTAGLWAFVLVCKCECVCTPVCLWPCMLQWDMRHSVCVCVRACIEMCVGMCARVASLLVCVSVSALQD